jgi:dienelactone hydrolase
MSIRRRIASLISGAVVAGVISFAAGEPTVQAQEIPTSPETRARAFVDLMARGQYAEAFESFTPQMKAAMPVDRLSETWKALASQAGPFRRQIGTTITPRGVLSVVVVTCEFERATLDVHVTVNPANMVGGLALRPAAKAFTYAPPAYARPATYQESEVTVGTGQWALPATLTMPVGPGPVPAVVLVHGSGPGDRDATVGQIKQFKDLALGLASRGIAVLRYDKRTRVHASEMRDLAVRTVKDETIDDALAAARLLGSTPRVDPKRIFVLGHSLGGMLVPRIAAAGPSSIAGFIVMAGAARPLQQALVEQSQYLAMADGTISAEERTQIDQFEQLAARIAALGPADTSKRDLIFGAPASYWLDLRGYDPPAAATKVQQPMLVLQGERDYQVTMEEFNRWRSALASRADVTFRSYASLNHLFVAGDGMSLPAEYYTPGHVSENVVDDIATWIMGVGSRRQDVLRPPIVTKQPTARLWVWMDYRWRSEFNRRRGVQELKAVESLELLPSCAIHTRRSYAVATPSRRPPLFFTNRSSRNRRPM